MSGHAHNIQDEIKRYYKVFFALMVLTVITVAVAGLKVGIGVAITLALFIATIKASLVASIFMHLIAERKAIYVLMGFTMFFFISMILLIIYGKYSVPERTEHPILSVVEMEKQAQVHKPHGTIEGHHVPTTSEAVHAEGHNNAGGSH